MIPRLIALSIRYRTLVVLIAVACAVGGFISAIHSPMDAVPDLSENQVIVFSTWPGHGPHEVEEQVTYPLSLQLQGLPGVRVVRGSSDIGYSMLYIIFDDHVSFKMARQRVQERLAALETTLPDGIVPRLAADGIPTGQIYWYTVEGAGYDLAQLRSLQDWTIAPQLRSVPGIAEVASVGGFVSELQIQVEPDLLAEFGLTVQQLGDELARPTSTVGGHVLHKGNAEYVVQLDADTSFERQIADWQQRRIPIPGGSSIRLEDVAKIAWGAAVRRGMFEKDGNEVIAGIVHLRYGHNPLDVTTQVRARLREIGTGLPPGVRILPCYDRTPLIRGAVGTVTRALIEALLVAAVCVLLVLRHFRAWLVIALSLPLTVLGTFLWMSILRTIGWLDIQTNIMSLAGMVISIGVLIDSSIVITENVMHQLRLRFGDRPVEGDVTDTVTSACQTVGWPVFCSILVMLVSFAPVFALGGIDGRMYGPLAWTKSLALISAALLAVTLVPALSVFLVRGKIRDESESVVVRSVISVYRPMLSWLMDFPDPLLFLLCVTVTLAAIPLGSTRVFYAAIFCSLVLFLGRPSNARELCRGIFRAAALIVISLMGQHFMQPIGFEMRLPLDEGMVMDMPITIPRASITQSGDDLKARNMILCRFPEVSMVTGKAGRAETPFDPAPLDMIETMIEFRPRDLWPRRRLLHVDAERMASRFIDRLTEAKLFDVVTAETRHEIYDAALFRFDAIQRETAWQFTEDFLRLLKSDLAYRMYDQLSQELFSAGQIERPLSNADIVAGVQNLPSVELRDLSLSQSAETVGRLLPLLMRSLEDKDSSQALAAQQDSSKPTLFGVTNLLRTIMGLEASTIESRIVAAVQDESARRWRKHVAELNRTLHQRAVNTWLRLVASECHSRGQVIAPGLLEIYAQIDAAKKVVPKKPKNAQSHHGEAAELPFIDPYPPFDQVLRQMSDEFSRSLLLWPHDATSLAAFGGEMDRTLQMPGWTNVWTRPIQNRVDMLATGVNAEVGVRVLGRNLDDVVQASEQIAAALKDITGAADVVADPIRGKGLIQVAPDAQQCAALGVSVSDLQATLESSLSGRVLTQVLDGRERRIVRLRTAATSADDDEETLRRLPIPTRPDYATDHDQAFPEKHLVGSNFVPLKTVPLEMVAAIKVTEGPATIKSENGWLRNYVRLNVRDRNPFDFVEQAKHLISQRIKLPNGVFVEWTGQFEHAEKTRNTLLLLIPAVILIICGMLYVTYHDWTDASLMLLSAPGALAGGVLCQWLLGYKFSIAVGVGYIACFGMAAATGIVMLVYLREAVDLAGGLERMTLADLKRAVLEGAVHRLRPKLLTEATTILGLAPMLWSDGIGAEVIRPMAAPVLGGILIADEVIDLLIPVLFYHVRRYRWKQLHAIDKNADPSELASS